MGKIKTEGVGEVQEFVDIVRQHLSFPPFPYSFGSLVRLRRRPFTNDEWQGRGVRAPWSHYSGRLVRSRRPFPLGYFVWHNSSAYSTESSWRRWHLNSIQLPCCGLRMVRD